MKRVLITGGSGYLAGVIVERLRERYALTLTDLVDPPDVRAGIPFVRGDLAQMEDAEAACAGQEAVVHTAALVRGRGEKPLSLFADVMVKGAWHVADACVKQGVGRLVNISSIVAVEAQLSMGSADDGPRPFGAGDLNYALSKSLAERICLAHHQAHGLSVTHLRPGVIAGDGANPGPEAPKDASGPWFVYVDPRDVAQAVELALETDLAYGAFQIVAGRKDSMFDWRSAARDLGYRPEHNWPEIEDTGETG